MGRFRKMLRTKITRFSDVYMKMSAFVQSNPNEQLRFALCNRRDHHQLVFKELEQGFIVGKDTAASGQFLAISVCELGQYNRHLFVENMSVFVICCKQLLHGFELSVYER